LRSFCFMKENIDIGHGETVLQTVPTCDTCLHCKSKIEMVAPHVSGTVDDCDREDIHTLAYPDKCPSYEKNIRTKISDFFQKIRQGRLHRISAEELGYPKEHTQLLMDTIKGKIRPTAIVSYIDDEGVTRTEAIYPDNNKK